ncbi:SGNH/GDSL hydrolase family protein [Nitrospira sp. Nam80]
MPGMLDESGSLSQIPTGASAPLSNQRRFTVCVAAGGIVLVGLMAVSFLFVCAWELKLEADHAREWEIQSKQIRPHYTWQFVTHDGFRVSHEHRGPLKLALHPFAVYSNLPDHHTPYFRINRMGFRGPETELVHGPRQRIVVVGGSTAFGTGLDQDSETFASQLGDLLNAEVINGAVIGHSSGQELAYLLMNLVDLQPDLVLALDGWNDYSKRKELKDRRLLGTNGFEQIEGRLRRLADQRNASLLKRAGYLPQLLFPRVTARLSESKLGIWTGMRAPEEARWLPVEAAAETYVANIVKMNKLAAAFHYRFLCMIQPEVGSHADYQLFRDTVKAAFKRHEVPFVDLQEMGIITDDMFLDVVHVNAAGHRTMAEVAAEKIAHDRMLHVEAR